MANSLRKKVGSPCILSGEIFKTHFSLGLFPSLVESFSPSACSTFVSGDSATGTLDSAVSVAFVTVAVVVVVFAAVAGVLLIGLFRLFSAFLVALTTG